MSQVRKNLVCETCVIFLGVMKNQNNSLPSPQCKSIFLTILSVTSIYNVSELHLSQSLNFIANKYFSRVDLENIRNKSSVMWF